MKLTNPTILVPCTYREEDGSLGRAWNTFAFNGEVDKRRIKRMIHKAFRKQGTHLHCRFVYEVMRRYSLAGQVHMVAATTRDTIQEEEGSAPTFDNRHGQCNEASN